MSYAQNACELFLMVFCRYAISHHLVRIIMNEQKYIFTGVVHPQRAAIYDKALKVYFGVGDNPSRWYCDARILCNQLFAEVITDVYVNEFDLKNTVEGLINCELARLGFILGYDFKLSIDRVVNREIGLDRVFGIDNPYISALMDGQDFDALNMKLRALTTNIQGTFFSRAMNDLKSALSNRDDAAFYCFRALESLKNHCNFTQGLSPKKSEEWVAFRDFLGLTKEDIIEGVKIHSDAIRHGHPVFLDEEDYKSVMTKTWKWTLDYVLKMKPE